MRKIWFRVFALVFWLGMLSWLLRYEAFPDFFTRAIAGYRSILPSDTLMEDSWMRILLNNAPIGYSHTSLDVDEDNVVQHYTVGNTSEIKLNLMGEQQRIHMDTEVHLDVMHNLQKFSFDLASGGYSVLIKGHRAAGKTFQVALRTRDSAQRMQIEIPDDVVIYSPVMEMAMRRLRPGDHLTIRTLDPATLSTAPVTIRALREEPLTMNGVERPARVLATEYRGLSFLTWMDTDGNVLKEETPFGWTLERCTADEAFEALRKANAGEDVLKKMAVKCEGEIRDPTGCKALRLRLSGVAFERGAIASNRQTVESMEEAQADLLVKAAEMPSPRASGEVPADCRPFLESTPFVQCDHPDIVKRAKTVVGARTAPVEKALAVYEWVHKNVDKQMKVSLPSALDVLRTMKGDCNEHTYLFVALARAAGLPAKIKVGVVYHEGAFFYHAWPAAWVGEWLEMDPTWGQPAVDATHIALVEGEIADQLDLLKVIGRLRVKVLEEVER